jgi:hypothetical protein
VRQGNAELNPGTQPRIACGTPLTMGGGCQASPGVANIPFMIPFQASDIQVGVAQDHAAEIWVEVYAENATAGAGSALAANGISAVASISKGTITRMDGLYG